MTIDPDAERWVTVSEACELSGINGATIRQWYRSGRIPTQRAEGDRGAFLVPLAEVLRFGEEADAAGDDLGDPVLDLNASYWSLETSAARDEAAAARAELEEIRAQLAFLRGQLEEASASERAATKRADALEAEIAPLRRNAAATSSITDTSWLDLDTNRYESPVRGQGMPAPVDRGPVPAVAASTAFPVEANHADVGDAAVGDEAAAEPFHPGEHADDLLPSSEKKGRRGRR